MADVTVDGIELFFFDFFPGLAVASKDAMGTEVDLSGDLKCCLIGAVPGAGVC